MTNNLFMVDIETTGTDIKNDDILQISIVQMVPRPDGLYDVGKFLDMLLPCTRQPTSLFAKEHMQDLYKKCNELARIKPTGWNIREEIVSFFRECGCVGPVPVFCGQNASSFDVPFLVEKGYLVPCSYQNIDGVETKVGDFSYRIYELSGVLYSICDAFGVDRNEAIESAIELDAIIPMPSGNRHDGYVDCIRQIKMLNGLLKKIRLPY